MGALSLDAATTVRRDDRPGKEALCSYLLRPPLAQQRVTLQRDGLVRIAL